MHPEAWNPAWNVETILTGFLSFMTSDSEFGAGCIYPASSETERLNKAKESKRWNSLECSAFRREFFEVHRDNIGSEGFSKAERKRLVDYERERHQLEKSEAAVGEEQGDDDCRERLLDMRYESYVNEDWEKFGSMEEDFDYYDDEDDEDYGTSDAEMECEE